VSLFLFSTCFFGGFFHPSLSLPLPLPAGLPLTRFCPSKRQSPRSSLETREIFWRMRPSLAFRSQSTPSLASSPASGRSVASSLRAIGKLTWDIISAKAKKPRCQLLILPMSTTSWPSWKRSRFNRKAGFPSKGFCLQTGLPAACARRQKIPSAPRPVRRCLHTSACMPDIKSDLRTVSFNQLGQRNATSWYALHPFYLLPTHSDKRIYPFYFILF